MRNVNKNIEINSMQPVTLTKTITNQEFIEINEDKSSKIIRVVIQNIDGENNVISEERQIITSEKYDILMSANPTFAPSKPENEYREEDLWYIIDLINQESTAQ